MREMTLAEVVRRRLERGQPVRFVSGGTAQALAEEMLRSARIRYEVGGDRLVPLRPLPPSTGGGQT